MIDEIEILANGSLHLPINKILGSSIKSPSLFTVQDDVVAYTAGSGVVVSKLDKVKGNVISQRFFCVNSKQDASASANPYAPSSANAYLNMIKKEMISPSTNEDAYKADSFGYPFETIISGSSSDNHLDSNPKVENSGSITFDVNSSSPSKFKDRVRSISCLSISPNKSVLAIGEIGYHPRIALFSLAPDLSSSPIALIYEHSFGINSISFAPDLRTFSSLGLLNDGFLNIWRFNTNPSGCMESIQLQASNKCTSVVNRLLWHENYIITLGLRMVKVWKYEERRNNNNFNNMALKGKNVLLGQLINSNFIEGEGLSTDEVLIMTDSSQILLLKLQYDNLKLIILDSSSITRPFHTMCIDYTGEKVWFGCEEGVLETLQISELKESTSKVKTVEQPSNSKLATMLNSPLNPSHSNSNSSSSSSSTPSNNLMLKLFDYDDDRLLVYTPNQELKLIDKLGQSRKVIVSSLLNNLSGIKDSYLKELLVFSKEGIIKKIDYEDHYKESIIGTLRLPSNELIPNSLTAVEKLNEKVFACGDKHGNIYVGTSSTDEETLSIEYQIKAHTSSVNEVIFFERIRNYYMCSISRDRMIQIFKKSKSDESGWDILQTLPTHSANILRVFHTNDKLYTCSSDRTISIHSIVEDEDLDDKVTVIQEKIISLKNTPITMKLYGNDLIVSTSDKVLLIYKINENFELKRSLKLTNANINESLLIENFVVHNNVIIASSSDKSLRIFNYQLGKPIAVYWGHLDSILSLKLVSNFNELLSISLDGCLFKWNLKSQRTEEVSRDQARNENQPKNLEYVPLYAKVTRKIIPNIVTAPSSTRTPTRSRRSSISSSPTREEKEQSTSPPTPTVPRLLSAATLKRMETRTESKSPSKQQQPPLNRSLSSSPTKALNRYSWSPTKLLTPTHKKRMLLDNVTNKLIPAAVIQEKSDTNLFMERSISHLTMMKSNLTNARLGDDDKLKLKTMLKDLHDTLSDGKDSLEDKENGVQSNKENEILELYSDKLINMFQTKLQLVEKNNNLSARSISRSSTEGIFKRIYSNDFNSNEVE